MSTKAYTQDIKPFGSGISENNSVHQTSPAHVLTFVRWAERDTIRTRPSKDVSYQTTRGVPLVVENDCIQLDVASNKGTLTPSMSATLLMTDVNYETALAPGDFVFVNILNWETTAKDVAKRATDEKPINGPTDGFKGMFKIQSVRKTIAVTNPQSGAKSVVIKITGFAFTEFNNTIYFNDQLFSKEERESNLLFLKNLKEDWISIVKALRGSQDSNLQDLIKFLIDSFIGLGVNETDSLSVPHKNFNTHFYMPSMVGNLLGIPTVKAAKDIYTYVFGLQDYSGNATSISQGMNPSRLKKQERNFWTTREKCKGYFVPASGMWNNEKAWSILNQYVNPPLNELYTCFKISPNGSVMPTVIFRQAPFTKEDFDNMLKNKQENRIKLPVTRFMTLPRWKIDPAMVINMDIGRDEAARINFVQYTGNSFIGAGRTAMDAIASGNYLYDIEDVKRNGLKPAMFTTPFDVSPNSNGSMSPAWAKIIGDFLIGGHLLMNGTLACAGIEDPIAVGDNLEFDGVVYHIEQVMHRSSITPDGIKSFRTTISISHGISVDSEMGNTKYAEMSYPHAYDNRAVDWENNQILPGVSEAQDITGREKSKMEHIKNKDEGSFVQPDIGVSVNSTKRGERDKK
jgi:hypothetical protein